MPRANICGNLEQVFLVLQYPVVTIFKASNFIFKFLLMRANLTETKL